LAASIFEIAGLHHLYQEKPVLEIERLSIAPNSIMGLIGPNGSGKSTLLRLLGAIEKPTRGTILFKKGPIEPFASIARFSITLLPQEPYLMRRSVFKNVAYGLLLKGIEGDLRRRVHEALSFVGLQGEDFERRSWYALSGGESHRVALAARLALKPEVLLLDEPTANVDAMSAQLIKEASLRARQEWGTTLVIASHDWQWLYEVCDDVIHLFKGRILGGGHENIVVGPWQPGTDGHWERRLTDGQCFVVPAPPSPRDNAIIALKAATDTDETAADFKGRLLSGVITRLTLEKTTGDTLVSVLVGGLPLTLKVLRPHVKEANLYPGCEIMIEYEPNSVQWV
jgi:tungstate transport system ATP-binding protein